MKPIAIYHEHPDWFKPLFAALEKRGLTYVRINPSEHKLGVDFFLLQCSPQLEEMELFSEAIIQQQLVAR